MFLSSWSQATLAWAGELARLSSPWPGVDQVREVRCHARDERRIVDAAGEPRARRICPQRTPDREAAASLRGARVGQSQLQLFDRLRSGRARATPRQWGSRSREERVDLPPLIRRQRFRASTTPDRCRDCRGAAMTATMTFVALRAGLRGGITSSSSSWPRDLRGVVQSSAPAPPARAELSTASSG